MSPFHFHRVFKAETGLTPKAYASASRARKLREELSAVASSVTDAIYGAGFNSNGRFSPAPGALGSTIQTRWGRPGFDAGSDAVQGMPRSSLLVNPSGKLQTPITSVLLSPLNTGETLH
jgi:hypothetical protein